jgi:hypothetical protein
MGYPLLETRIDVVELEVAALDINMGEREVAIGSR